MADIIYICISKISILVSLNIFLIFQHDEAKHDTFMTNFANTVSNLNNTALLIIFNTFVIELKIVMDAVIKILTAISKRRVFLQQILSSISLFV